MTPKTRARRKARTKRVRMWGGFVDGKLHEQTYREEGWGYPEDRHSAVFPCRAAARRRYQDVRPVTVLIQAPPAKRGKK